MHRIILIVILVFSWLTREGTVAQESAIRYGRGVPLAVRVINDRSLNYLAETQKEDGSWSGDQSGPGITGICVMAFMASGEDQDASLVERRGSGAHHAVIDQLVRAGVRPLGEEDLKVPHHVPVLEAVPIGVGVERPHLDDPILHFGQRDLPFRT